MAARSDLATSLRKVLDALVSLVRSQPERWARNDETKRHDRISLRLPLQSYFAIASVARLPARQAKAAFL